MFSMPPASTTSDSPDATCWLAEMIACRPEPQTRLSVIPGTLGGRPASNGDWCHGAAGYLWALLTSFGDDSDFREEIDWAAVRGALSDVGYGGWITAEVPFGNLDAMKDVVRRMNELLQLA